MLHSKYIISSIIFGLFGCGRVISVNEIRDIEINSKMGNEIQWIYNGSKGEYHEFIHFYKNSFGGTAYETIKIPRVQLGLKIVIDKPNKILDGENGNNIKSLQFNE